MNRLHAWPMWRQAERIAFNQVVQHLNQLFSERILFFLGP